MSRKQSAGAGRTIIEEVRQIIAAVEEFTGLPSRWNGSVLILADASGEDRAVGMLSRVPYLAKKEWNYGITVVESILSDSRRWRTLLHEALHSVSVGLNQPDYERYTLWEEAVVESLQRLYRPLLFGRLGLAIEETQFKPMEAVWRYNRALEALGRVAAERPEVPGQEFLEQLLGTPLLDRPAFAFEWGRQSADFEPFKRVYAAASGILR
jgi:hypothetical protein